MRKLFLVRHAKSSWDNPGLRDFNRPLNDRGLHDAPLMAALLVKAGYKPELLVSSPAKRALTTALFFAEAFGVPADAVLRNEHLYEAMPPDVLRIISQLPDTAESVMLFGHNPTFTDVANRFTSIYIDNVPTCGVVLLESSAGSWPELYEGNTDLKICYFPKEVL